MLPNEASTQPVWNALLRFVQLILNSAATECPLSICAYKNIKHTNMAVFFFFNI